MRDLKNKFYKQLSLDSKTQEALKLYRFIKVKMLKDLDLQGDNRRCKER